MFKPTIFFASALLKHWFWMKLAAQTRVSSLSWDNRFTALSIVISGVLFSDFLWKKTVKETIYTHTYILSIKIREEVRLLQCHDIACVCLLHRDLYLLSDHVHFNTGDWGWIGVHSARGMRVPLDIGHGPVQSMYTVLFPFEQSLVMVPARAVVFRARQKHVILKHRLWKCCVSEWRLAEAGTRLLRSKESWPLWKGVALIEVRGQGAVEHSGHPV